MGRYSYHRLAAQEFLDAATWYGSRDRAVEIERRAAEIDAGEVKLLDWEVVGNRAKGQTRKR